MWSGCGFWLAHFIVSMPATRLTWGPWIAWGEPRVTMTLQVAAAGLIVIAVTWLVDSRRFTAVANLLLGLTVFFLVERTGVLRHPLDPIGASPSSTLRLIYLFLVLPIVASMFLVAWRLTAAAVLRRGASELEVSTQSLEREKPRQIMKIVNVEEMRRIEQAADSGGQSYAAMMEMAGGAIANISHALMAPEADQPILLLIGPGNNGGDGLVAARELMQIGHPVAIYVWKRDTKGDQLFRQLKRKRRGITILYADNDPGFAKLREELRNTDLVIDALLGTGAMRPIEGTLAELLAIAREELTARRQPPIDESDGFALGMPRFPIMEAMALGTDIRPNQPAGDAPLDEFFPEEFGEEDFDEEEDGPDDDEWDDWEDDEAEFSTPFPHPSILAVDCPSGLNCDTGAMDPAALAADATITFGFPKWGQLQHPGAAACGLLTVADIGVSPELSQEIQTELIEPRQVSAWLPKRRADAHKGTFGRAMIAAGSLNYTGAAYLSSSAAAHAGAGLVTLAIPAPLHAVLAGALPEITWLPLPGPEGVHTADGAARLISALSELRRAADRAGLDHAGRRAGVHRRAVRAGGAGPRGVAGTDRGRRRCAEPARG